MTALLSRLVTGLSADLDPSTDQARQWFRDELAKGDYQDTRSLLQRLVGWLGDRLADLQSAQGSGGISLPPVVVTVVVLLLAVGAGYLLTRLRAGGRALRAERTVLGGTTHTADQLRREAEQALVQGRAGDAVLAWTRALARDAEERTLLPGAQSMTAHEVGVALGSVFPDHADLVRRVVDLFDAVAYGGYRANRDDAVLARTADGTLRTARPAFASARLRRVEGGGPSDGPGPPAPSSPGAAPDHGSVWLTGVRS